ncbi:MAG: L-glutamate gamma-semialdehyde dehydrogenase [Bacteroidales bacterium]|jgi:1-pyrroline-5-carboxylate dehydrogenase|nr:L-glutamate gamma-semialdehyde dehydrogenase [Bacteroidales bacterium]
MRKYLEVPEAYNEPVLEYAPGSVEREELRQVISEMRSRVADIPMIIGGREIRTGRLEEIHPPHDRKHLLGHYHRGDKTHVEMAISAALEARREWAGTPWKQRASIFLRAASLVSGPYRQVLNAATMLGQSKTIHQAEIDASCEFADFLRYNVQYMNEIYQIQPENRSHTWNRLEQRPLEGFVYALSPFNFTSIAANLAAAPVLMGNVVVWKPSNTQIYSADIIMKIYREAGLPDGVINIVYVPGPMAADVVLSNRHLAGIHFTGSTGVFNSVWKTVGANIGLYKNYPRIVGETGGKDFIVAHPSANPRQVATAMARGAFEYQGQKCSAPSRAYIPASLWPEIRKMTLEQIDNFRMGVPEDFSNFITAVIDEKAFDKISSYIEEARKNPQVEIICGGKCDKSTGYFIEPTILLSNDPCYITMQEEIFGPVLTVYVYKDDEFDDILKLIDKTSVYGLTGAVFARERDAVMRATDTLRYSAGNFYINDKPTGAVVGHQPFGGSRASGTNDKAGSALNLMRWVSPRTIKECFMPPEDWKYPFLSED